MKLQRLTEAEERIMRYYWEHGPCLVSAIIDKMPDPKPAHSTISTITRSLQSKGYLTHKAYGRTHEYHVAVPQEKYSRSRVGKVMDDFFESSPRELISFLIKDEQVNPSDLRKLLEDLENDQS